jgi:hypothetical protein
MTDRCPNCDTPQHLTECGLCPHCRDQLRFVVRPAAHREMYRRGLAEQEDIRADLERAGIVIVSSLPLDNSLWVCDLCNAEIPITEEHTLIPLMGSYALCIPCASTYPFWPEGWTQPRPRACRCGACQRPLLNVLARL